MNKIKEDGRTSNDLDAATMKKYKLTSAPPKHHQEPNGKQAAVVQNKTFITKEFDTVSELLCYMENMEYYPEGPFSVYSLRESSFPTAYGNGSSYDIALESPYWSARNYPSRARIHINFTKDNVITEDVISLLHFEGLRAGEINYQSEMGSAGHNTHDTIRYLYYTTYGLFTQSFAVKGSGTYYSSCLVKIRGDKNGGTIQYNRS
ncbi:MAG: hypothetical protein K0R59_149 [Sphingobacterium sp.]|jgi:hypothetical protein|nr:hypothetical protein [Sphingobacterium sp.]